MTRSGKRKAADAADRPAARQRLNGPAGGSVNAPAQRVIQRLMISQQSTNNLKSILKSHSKELKKEERDVLAEREALSREREAIAMIASRDVNDPEVVGRTTLVNLRTEANEIRARVLAKERRELTTAQQANNNTRSTVQRSVQNQMLQNTVPFNMGTSNGLGNNNGNSASTYAQNPVGSSLPNTLFSYNEYAAEPTFHDGFANQMTSTDNSVNPYATHQGIHPQRLQYLDAVKLEPALDEPDQFEQGPPKLTGANFTPMNNPTPPMKFAKENIAIKTELPTAQPTFSATAKENIAIKTEAPTAQFAFPKSAEANVVIKTEFPQSQSPAFTFSSNLVGPQPALGKTVLQNMMNINQTSSSLPNSTLQHQGFNFSSTLVTPKSELEEGEILDQNPIPMSFGPRVEPMQAAIEHIWVHR